MRFSPFLFVWKKGTHLYLWQSLTMELMRLPTTTDLTISTMDESLLNTLIEKEMIVPNDFAYTDRINKCRTLLIANRLNTLYLVLTYRCNFDCRYCFLPRGSGNMEWETAKRFIDSFIHLPREKKTLVFYGGEPLLEYRLFEKCVTYARNAGSSMDIGLVTNGSLINEDLALFLKKNRVSTTISLDGPPHINDKMRILPSGGGSYNMAASGINHLMKNNVPFSIACTIHPYNADQIERVVSFLIEMFNPVGFDLNLPPLPPANVCEDFTPFEERFEETIRVYELLREKNMVPGSFYKNRIRNFVTKTPLLSTCGGCGECLVATSDGYLQPCFIYEDQFGFRVHIDQIASLKDFETSEVWAEWKARNTLNMPQCAHCPAILLCGGGCLYNAYKKYGTIWKVPEETCRFSQKCIEFLVTHD
jgi:uncharacterized protein